MQLAEMTKIIKINSALILKCDHCNFTLNGLDDFSSAVNHLIEEHGYKIIHIGQETQKTKMGESMQLTVAILGK